MGSTSAKGNIIMTISTCKKIAVPVALAVALAVAATLLVLPYTTQAAFNDVILTNGAVTINVASLDLTLTAAGVVVESVIVNAGTFVVALKSGSSISVVSTDSTTYTLSPTSGEAFTADARCIVGQSILTMSASGTATITVTPTGTACEVEVAGGGGIVTSTPTPVVVDTTSTPVVETTSAPESSVTNVVPTVQEQVSPSQPSTVAFSISRTLGIGDVGDDVKNLQQILNRDVDTRLADSGIGSVGNESDFFGSLTQRAVQRFQEKYDIVSSGSPETTGYGLVGPLTRSKLQGI